MKKITQEMVREYKRMDKVQLHDEAWHEYMDKDESEAIGYVLGSYDIKSLSLADIVKEANNYFDYIYVYKKGNVKRDFELKTKLAKW